MSEPAEITHIESRWPVALVIALVGLLLTLLPDRIRVAPTWVPSVVTILIIAPMIALSLNPAKALWLRIESIVISLFFVVTGLGLLDQLTVLLSAMLRRSSDISGFQLLTSSIAVWAGTVLLFSVAYWRTDRGGPEARANRASTKPDWLFPQETLPRDVPRGWRPTFIDYLFLSYCAATAFSPSGPQPLTSRAMLLLMLESMISLITIIAIAARAISLLS